MKHCDWRSLGRETQETIRKIAVRAVDENNESPADVIRILGITRSRLYLISTNLQPTGATPRFGVQ